VDIKVVICRRKNLPSHNISRKFSGKYKGIPWDVVIENPHSDKEKRIFFYSKIFANILAKQIVHLPYLKHKCITNGSFLLICSTFSYEGKLFVLFGYSGTGKTNMMLKALEKGAKCVGDERLILFPSGSLIDYSSTMALGYATVKDTKYWNKLSIENKILLWIYHLIFILTKKYVKFNIYLNPEQLGIEKDNHLEGKKVIFVNFVKEGKKCRMSLSETAATILENEDRYQKLYGDIFSLADQRDKTNEMITSFFADSSFWRIRIGTPLDDILSLE